MTKEKLQGTFYQRGERWYWKVRLPGEDKFRAFPLAPKGAKFATKDRAVAENIARDIWTESLYAKSESKGGQCNRIADLIQMYNSHSQAYYRHKDGTQTSQVALVKISLQYLNDFCGALEPESFGPLKLQEFRQILIEKKFSRQYINTIIGIVKRLFKWGASQEKISGNIYRDLLTVDGLREGRSEARETEKVKPVSEDYVYAILPYASKVIAAMMQLHLLTGARSTELCIMTPNDIDKSKDVWLYRLGKHKNTWRGKNKIIAIGPKAQKILQPFLSRPPESYCFSPDESLIKIKGGKISRQGGKAKQPRYNHNSYRKAIQYAIDAYNKVNPDKQIPYFTPHQSRHTLATKIDGEMGREASAAAIGDTIDVAKIYAERNLKLAIEVARKFG